MAGAERRVAVVAVAVVDPAESFCFVHGAMSDPNYRIT